MSHTTKNAFGDEVESEHRSEDFLHQLFGRTFNQVSVPPPDGATTELLFISGEDQMVLAAA